MSGLKYDPKSEQQAEVKQDFSHIRLIVDDLVRM